MTDLIRVYFPGVFSTDTINGLGSATYTNKTVQDIVDEGLMYIETDFTGAEQVCMVTVYGKTTLSINIESNITVSPEPLQPDYFVGGRPEVIRKPK